MFYITAILPLTLAIVGVTYAFSGRSAVIRRRARTVYTQWRMTT